MQHFFLLQASVPKHSHTKVTYEQLCLRKHQKPEVRCATTTQTQKKKKNHTSFIVSEAVCCRGLCLSFSAFVDRLQQEGSPPRRLDIIDVGKSNTLPVPWVSFWDYDHRESPTACRWKLLKSSCLIVELNLSVIQFERHWRDRSNQEG